MLSPCSLPLLPGLVSYYLGEDFPTKKAVILGVACSSGTASILLLTGLIGSLVGSLLFRLIPFFKILTGLTAIVLGLALLTGRSTLVFSLPTKTGRRKDLIGMFLFGVSYGMVSLECSAPVFLSMLLYASASGIPLEIALVVIAYTLGAGIPLVIACLLVAETKGLILRYAEGFSKYLPGIGGAAMVGVGVYLILLGISGYSE